MCPAGQLAKIPGRRWGAAPILVNPAAVVGASNEPLNV